MGVVSVGLICRSITKRKEETKYRERREVLESGKIKSEKGKTEDQTSELNMSYRPRKESRICVKV